MNKLLLAILPWLVSSFPVQQHVAQYRRLACTKSTARPALPLDSALSAVDTFFQTKPYMSAFLTCSVKASAADLVAQTKPAPAVVETKVEESSTSEQVDFQRNLAFILYGGIYQGLFQEFLYGTLFPAWFGSDSSLETVAKQVAADVFFCAPLLCLPCAYMIKSAVMSNEISVRKAQQGLAKYVQDVQERALLFKFWAVWIPADSLAFSVIPAHFRILFVASISFFWMFLLSTISNSKSSTAK